MRGITLQEACVLSLISYEKFEALMSEHSAIRDFIAFKQASYKAALMTTMAASATTGRQTKTAGYLLEQQFRSEFGKKLAGDTERSKDELENAISFVRENGDRDPLVRRLPAPPVRPVRASEAP